MTPQEMAVDVAECEDLGLRAVMTAGGIVCRPHRDDCLHADR